MLNARQATIAPKALLTLSLVLQEPITISQVGGSSLNVLVVPQDFIARILGSQLLRLVVLPVSIAQQGRRLPTISYVRSVSDVQLAPQLR